MADTAKTPDSACSLNYGTSPQLREAYAHTVSGPAADRNVVFGRRGYCRQRTSGVKQVAYLFLGAACWHQLQPTRNIRTFTVTCDDTSALMFTLIVQRMPVSACCCGRNRGTQRERAI